MEYEVKGVNLDDCPFLDDKILKIARINVKQGETIEKSCIDVYNVMRQSLIKNSNGLTNDEVIARIKRIDKTYRSCVKILKDEGIPIFDADGFKETLPKELKELL